MKLARALLLSSINQAQSWEGTRYTILSRPMMSKRYRFLVIDNRLANEGLLFEIYCVHREDVGGRMADVVADLPHVSEMFADLGVLHNFLHRFQIDIEDWSPVEPE